MKKNITVSILLFAGLFSCQENNNIFEDLTQKGGFVEFSKTPELLHDVLGSNQEVINATVDDRNKNALSYAVAVEKEDGTLSKSVGSTTSFPGNIVINREKVLEVLGVTSAKELPQRVTFVGIVTTPQGIFTGQNASFNTSTNKEDGGNTTVSLLAISPSAMRFTVVMFQLISPNVLASIPISSANDDVEEIAQSNGEAGIVGTMDLTSSDLEFGELSGGQGLMTTGLRFNFVGLPKGAKIKEAYVQFSVDNVGSKPAEMTIYGENVANSPEFKEEAFNLSKRALTKANVVWSIPAWTTNGERGEKQRTVDISSIVQEIIDRDDWIPGNSITIIIKNSGVSLTTASTSSGREASTYPDASIAPELKLSYN